ncbi:TRAP transporter substrate-binding protein [Methylobacterium sp. A49B]|uniref:TRAP transporter substrate-binding protein n=1 Tax=Methylobacterium mesophilicum SR1.6/6 TaxID=908290 RepID=A0A6B9FLX5_9HYPH|nr:TRAP transporter substrate-binding protein [Methylobacterium mesophilicum]QGY03407.1 TRAP transporter substrate-binding protein [Methylobacterium mesophilicum SR1.6/6]
MISRRTFAGAVLGAPVALPFLARSGFAATPTHTLKLTFADTQAHPLYAVLKRFAENVNKRTDGAVDIQVFSIGQLGSGTNIITGMQTGIIDLCAHTSGFIGPLFPRFQVVDLPFLFPDAKTAERVLDGPVGGQLLDLMPAKGIYGLSYGHWGWRVVSTVERKVPEPADIKGLKIRVQPGAIFAAMFRTLSANPIAIDLTEVYLALSQRTIEAIETPMISVAAGKHDEVVRTINTTNHVYNVGVLMASKAKFDALPEQARSAIRAAAQDMTGDWRTTIAAATDETAARFKAKGLAILPVDQDAYRRQVEPVYKQFRDIIGPDLVDAVMKEVGKG